MNLLASLLMGTIQLGILLLLTVPPLAAFGAASVVGTLSYMANK